MKKIKLGLFVVLGAVLLFAVFSGCSKDTGGNQTDESRSVSQTVSSSVETSQAEAEKQYIHIAAQGCIIDEQDGYPTFTYTEKCERCGETSLYSETGTSTPEDSYYNSFFCDNCQDWQVVEVNTIEK
ncbi:MAG: hypothetical protein IJ731_10335 [Eubacterium sp.]|nr:hypothetical protein [Eubacterium sp.]